MGAKSVKQHSVLTTMRYVISETWAYNKKVFLYNGMFTLLTAVQSFIVLFVPKLIIDELTTSRRVSYLLILLLIMFLASSINGFFTAYLFHLGKTEIMKVTFRFIRKLTEMNLKTDYKNTEDPSFLSKMESAKRSLHNVNAGLQGVLNNLFSLGGSVITFFGYSAIIGSFNSYILSFLFLSVVVSYSLTLRAKHFEHSKSNELSEADRASGYVNEVMSDFAYGKDIRIYNLANMLASLFQTAVTKRYKIMKGIKQRYLRIAIVDIILVCIREGIVYSYLIYLYLASEITIANFLMYFVAIAGFAGWMQTVITDIAHLRSQNVYINDLRECLEDSYDNQNSSPLIQLQDCGPYMIEYRNVSFKYPNSENYILNNISLTIPACQKLAIVGHNGAGKTTFIKLLCRLYEPTQGEILMNGINIQTIPIDQYYKLLTAVFQEIKIMAFSVAENIAIEEHENIDYPNVTESLEKAGIKDKILSLDNGVHTAMTKLLDESGVELSGGENQKLALARGFYKKSKIIVLDEPTAALDALAEYDIYYNFNRVVGDKSALYISHRLSSTRFCDKIAFFENGQLLEYGTHQELLDKKGKYMGMFKVQARYYTDNEAFQ